MVLAGQWGSAVALGLGLAALGATVLGLWPGVPCPAWPGASLGLLTLAWVGYRLHLGWPFSAGLAAAAGVAAYHWTLIRARDPARCFKAFLHNNWFGAAVFAGIAASLLHW